MRTIARRSTPSTLAATPIIRSMNSYRSRFFRLWQWQMNAARPNHKKENLKCLGPTQMVGGRFPMANVVKKHSISFELAQKMVNAALAKARELGVSENVTILDDGGNLKAFSRMDGAPIATIERAKNKAYTALLGVSTQDFFNFIKGDPSLLAGVPTLARVAAWGGGFPIKVDGEIVGAIGVSGAPTVQNDVDCARAALALASGAVSAD